MINPAEDSIDYSDIYDIFKEQYIEDDDLVEFVSNSVIRLYAVYDKEKAKQAVKNNKIVIGNSGTIYGLGIYAFDDYNSALNNLKSRTIGTNSSRLDVIGLDVSIAKCLDMLSIRGRV